MGLPFGSDADAEHDAQLHRGENLDREQLIAKLREIEAMARRHCSPASNAGAHHLADAIVRICERE